MLAIRPEIRPALKVAQLQVEEATPLRRQLNALAKSWYRMISPANLFVSPSLLLIAGIGFPLFVFPFLTLFYSELAVHGLLTTTRVAGSGSTSQINRGSFLA